MATSSPWDSFIRQTNTKKEKEHFNVPGRFHVGLASVFLPSYSNNVIINMLVPVNRTSSTRPLTARPLSPRYYISSVYSPFRHSLSVKELIKQAESANGPFQDPEQSRPSSSPTISTPQTLPLLPLHVENDSFSLYPTSTVSRTPSPSRRYSRSPASTRSSITDFDSFIESTDFGGRQSISGFCYPGSESDTTSEHPLSEIEEESTTDDYVTSYEYCSGSDSLDTSFDESNFPNTPLYSELDATLEYFHKPPPRSISPFELSISSRNPPNYSTNWNSPSLSSQDPALPTVVNIPRVLSPLVEQSSEDRSDAQDEFNLQGSSHLPPVPVPAPSPRLLPFDTVVAPICGLVSQAPLAEDEYSTGPKSHRDLTTVTWVWDRAVGGFAAVPSEECRRVEEPLEQSSKSQIEQSTTISPSPLSQVPVAHTLDAVADNCVESPAKEELPLDTGYVPAAESLDSSDSLLKNESDCLDPIIPLGEAAALMFSPKENYSIGSTAITTRRPSVSTCPVKASLDTLPSCCQAEMLAPFGITLKNSENQPDGTAYTSVDRTLDQKSPANLEPDDVKFHPPGFPSGEHINPNARPLQTGEIQDLSNVPGGLDGAPPVAVPDVAVLQTPIDVSGRVVAPDAKISKRRMVLMKGQKVYRKGRKVVFKAPVLAIIVGRQLSKPTANALDAISKGKPVDIDSAIDATGPP